MSAEQNKVEYYTKLLNVSCRNCNKELIFLMKKTTDIKNNIVYFAKRNNDTVDIYMKYLGEQEIFFMSVPVKDFGIFDDDVIPYDKAKQIN